MSWGRGTPEFIEVVIILHFKYTFIWKTKFENLDRDGFHFGLSSILNKFEFIERRYEIKY